MNRLRNTLAVAVIVAASAMGGAAIGRATSDYSIGVYGDASGRKWVEIDNAALCRTDSECEEATGISVADAMNKEAR